MADRRAKGREAFGDRNGNRLHPERTARGDRHGSRTHPEKVPRGERHASRTSPEKIARGERMNTAKLTKEKVLDIRERYKNSPNRATIRYLAMRFNVTYTNISSIVQRKSWKHI